MSCLPLTAQVFTILSALIEERSGIYYGLDERELLADRVSSRAIEAGFDSLLDYYYYLRYDPKSSTEFDALIESLVVGETYLFRESDQLERLVTDVLTPLVREGVRPRIWSAACATGEEPLTLAILLEVHKLLEQVEIIASDISSRALERARRGQFGPRSVRRPLPEFASHFIERRGDAVLIRRELIERIDWRRVNLLDQHAVARLGTYDVIMCRNVLIYFRDETARKVVGTLMHQLRPNGVLLVGVAESLLRLSTGLVCEERRGAFFYRKA